MVVAVFTFGSFGDISSLLALVCGLREALHEVSGASAEIQALADDLGAFGRMLHEVDLAIARRQGSLRPDVLNGVRCALEACMRVLRAMNDRILSFRDRVTAAKGRAVWHLYWSAAAWGILGGKKEVASLKIRLFEQLAVIQTYLSVLESADCDAVIRSARCQTASVERVCASMHDLQSRFDVGIPAFHFCDQRTGFYYPPFARTSLQRFQDLYSAVNGSPLVLDLLTSGGTFMRTVPLARKKDSVIVPCIFNINCFFFREAAFGEWQVLMGFRLLDQAVSQLSMTLNIVKTLVQRKHTLGVACNCDGAHCHARFQREIEQSVYQTRCLECYSAAASIVFRKALSSWVEMARNYKLWDTVQRGIERETTPCPDPDYVHTTIIPALRKATRPGIDDMLRLFEAAPKLERPDAFSNLQAPSTSVRLRDVCDVRAADVTDMQTLQDLQSFRGWHHNPVLRFWDLL